MILLLSNFVSCIVSFIIIEIEKPCGVHFQLICHWLKRIFNVDCKANQVLNLDARLVCFSIKVV